MSDDSTQPSNQFASRGFIAAAIVIGVILLAGLVVLVTTLTAPHTSVTRPTTTPTGPVASGDDKSVCGLKGFETKSSLTAAPPQTKWELVGTVAAPTDPNVGPGKVDSDGFRTCFAHTAQGALYAAINYVALGSDSRNASRMAELFVPGPGVDIALKAGTGTPSSTRLQVAGFKVNSYSTDEATVDVVWSITSSSSQLVSFPTALRWDGGDWKIVLNDDGQPPFSASPLQSLGGYIPWAGV